MQIRRLSICNQFKCIGAACPANCCQGWKIPLDYNTYIKYLQEKGFFGTKLRFFIRRNEDTAAFRSAFGRCPFWGGDHLCEIQKKQGIEYMPAVCVQFPRQLYNLGFFCEETLYLACPEAARFFLQYVETDGPFDYIVMEGEVSYEVNTTNDDQTFLNYLIKSREELAGLLRTGMDFSNMAILAYGHEAQNACLAKAALPSPFSYMSEECFQINVREINQLLFDGFYHSNLRVTSHLLYKLCRKYIREFAMLSRINPQAADKKLLALQDGLYQKVPRLEKILNRYFEYYLLTNFLDIYEDYCFTRCLRFGIVKTKILLLFLALYAEHKDSMERAEIAKIIAIYERRAPHIKDALNQIELLH